MVVIFRSYHWELQASKLELSRYRDAAVVVGTNGCPAIKKKSRVCAPIAKVPIGIGRVNRLNYIDHVSHEVR